MARPDKTTEPEINAGRRALLTSGAIVGVASAVAVAPWSARAQQRAAPQPRATPPPPAPGASASSAVDPVAPPGLNPKGMLDSRYAMTFESSIPETMKVMSAFMAALNRRDLDGVAKTLQYPFVTYEGIDTVVLNSPDELKAKTPVSLNFTGKGPNKMKARTYDILDKMEVLFYTPIDAGIAMDYSRFGPDGMKLLACYGIYGVTNNDGKWGIEFMSTIFRPAEQLHLDYDAKEFAERGIHDSYRDHNLGRKYNGLNANYTEKALDNPGKWAGISIGAISYPKDQPEGWQMNFYKVKGVKSRLRVSERPITAPPERADASSDVLFRSVSGAGVGTWFESLEWAGTRVLNADMEKAHAISGNQRFTEQGELISQSQYMVVLLYRNGVWTASDGPSIFGRQMYQDRSNDVL